MLARSARMNTIRRKNSGRLRGFHQGRPELG
jgi:hypothetical protein